MEKYKVVIIGLGNIGYLYDRDLPEDEFIKSHFRAFSMHNDFKIVACIENNVEIHREIEKKYSVPCYQTINSIVDTDIDVFVVSVPTSVHLVCIKEILKKHKPKVILCEKPLSTDINSALKIVEESQKSGVQIFVNYIRRADPAIKYLKNSVVTGKFKLPFRAIIQYSNGILHNGSHFLDLLYHLFGEGRIISSKSINDINNPDATVGFQDGFATFCSTNSAFNFFGFKIFFLNGVYEYFHDGSANWIEFDNNLNQLDFDKMQPISNNAQKYQMLIVEELFRALKLEKNSLCTVDDAYKQHLLINEILDNGF